MADIVYEFGGGLYVNLTNRCPNHCDFCLRTTAPGIGGTRLWLEREPTAEEVVAALKAAHAERFGEIVFCGYGEPTCRIDVLTAAAEYAHRIGCKTRLNTNGQGSLVHGRNIAKELIGRVDAVSVSLNAPSAEEYQAICHSQYGPVAYEALWQFARDCRTLGIRVTMSVVDRIGADKVAECKELCDREGIRLKVRAYIEDAAGERATRLIRD